MTTATSKMKIISEI